MEIVAKLADALRCERSTRNGCAGSTPVSLPCTGDWCNGNIKHSECFDFGSSPESSAFWGVV